MDKLVSEYEVNTYERHHDLSLQRAALEAKGKDKEKKHLKTWHHKDNIYRVFSRSEKTQEEKYSVIVREDGTTRCHCKGYFYRETCVHSAAVERRLQRLAA